VAEQTEDSLHARERDRLEKRGVVASESKMLIYLSSELPSTLCIERGKISRRLTLVLTAQLVQLGIPAKKARSIFETYYGCIDPNTDEPLDKDGW
jgi:hypothetical protein